MAPNVKGVDWLEDVVAAAGAAGAAEAAGAAGAAVGANEAVVAAAPN